MCRKGLGVLILTAVGLSAAASAQGTAHGAEIFGRGTVSTEAPEFAASFTPDGRHVFFNRASADRQRLTIMTATRATRAAPDAWSAPVVAPFSGTFRDVDPFVTPDGRRLYFSSDRPRGGGTPGAFATWFVERTESGWGPPIDPGAPLNSTAGEVFVSSARDGTVLFTSSRLGAAQVFTSREIDGQWHTPVAISFGGRTDGGNPAIAPSGRFVILVVVPSGGSSDLYVSCRAGDTWSAPRALDVVNSRFADFAPNVDASETFLSFTSERPGLVAEGPAGARPPGDIYRIGLADAGVRCP